MKIGILSKSYELGGGASRVAAMLNKEINSIEGATSDHWAPVNHKSVQDLRGNFWQRQLYKLSRNISKSIGYPDIFSLECLNLQKSTDYDIFHFHDISDAISPLSIKKLSKTPSVWTFHDCSPFTGGCIYPTNCIKLKGGNCGDCPKLDYWPMQTKFDRTNKIQKMKIDIINDHLHLGICPSEWIKRTAIEAGVSPKKLKVINNGVNTDLFSRKDNLNTKKQTTILIHAMDLLSPLKGNWTAINTINKINKKLHVVLSGNGTNEMARHIDSKHEITQFPFTLSQTEIVRRFSMSDLILFFSNAENFPLTLLEAMSCGVIPIAIDSGGISEIISNNQNGILINKMHFDDAPDIITKLIQNKPEMTRLSEAARRSILERFSLKNFVNNHINLYKDILPPPR